MIYYQITPKNVNAHLFEVHLTLSNPNPLGQVFSLPNWIPGSYLVRDFTKHIVRIKAQSNGKSIKIKKLDKNHWIVQPCTNTIKLTYEVYAYDLSVRCAYLTNQRAFFNGSSVFLHALGFDQAPCEVTLNYPAEKVLGKWRCATTLTLKSKQQDSEIYTADNYEDLIDHPVEMADFSRFEFSVDNIPHAMTITGEHTTDIARLQDDLRCICQHHIDFFGGQVPFDEYLFLTLVTHKDYGGLEHKKSSSLICARKELPVIGKPDINPEYARFLALCSHEYFHAWWVKTVKPASFYNLDMSRENHTEQLWIFEGFTSYYDELSLLRTQLLSIEQYLTLFAQTISKVQRGTGRYKQSLAESSFDAWTKFYQQDENAPNAIVSYYTKGAVFAFVLDIEIRKRTNNKYSLDSVMRIIWQDYQTIGLEDDTVQTLVAEITQSDFSEFFDAYLYGVDDLPLKQAFDYIGINCEFIHKPGDLLNIGLGIDKTQKYAVVTHILDNSCVQNAGLYVRDKILSINGVKLKAKDLVKTLGSCNEGEMIKMGILRDKAPLEIKLNITLTEKSHCVLTPDAKSSQETLKRQKQWALPK
ncbi:M61 family metallopeptidase [Bathymodiolus septemdierum thioautotrophic gill symbiont]|uniref:Peptidase M61 n=1 Tax=endosymbiont of Bathymodiolus septemdierum str. Myojin knoll TaxID=1303921 RepID=A0A0P0USH7_9GAMM|nr:PDZ domain-containing protein [Bathymodiolus septemdierum thioautotrophic gill symbiont]BAS67845.1 peptidase M61 [endosymbiont of Bathymodiolus septemdierum str. Myojin knoll]